MAMAVARVYTRCAPQFTGFGLNKVEWAIYVEVGAPENAREEILGKEEQNK